MPPKPGPRGEYLETVSPPPPNSPPVPLKRASILTSLQENGNKISRKPQISGSTNIMLGGKCVIQADVVLRGDLIRTLPLPSSSSSSANGSGAGGRAPAQNVAIATGRYCIFSRGCVLRPPGRVTKGVFSYFPLKLGEHVYIGPGSVVEAAMIGSHVHIQAGCVIGKFAIIKEYVRILEGTVVPPNMVIPSFSIVAGRPARVVGEVPEGGIEAFDCREIYRSVGNHVSQAQGTAKGE
jgi:dynactin-5